MTRPELAKLVEQWRARLIPEWRVLLMDSPPPGEEDENYWGICEVKDDYQEACIYFPDESLKREEAEIEVTVIHELLHALLRPWQDQVNEAAMELSSGAASSLRQQRSHHVEMIVDRLSRVMATGVNPFGTENGPKK